MFLDTPIEFRNIPLPKKGKAREFILFFFAIIRLFLIEFFIPSRFGEKFLSELFILPVAALSQVDRDKETLRSNNINCNKILDCSDAHHFSDSSESNKLGNTFTWLNADFSFNGLFHAINDYENKVYIGVQPHKLKLVERNPTNYISQIEVRKLANSKLDEKWFNFNLAINNELVAIIGNKGKGKSALADIIAFLGKSSIPQHFSFLTNSRFREPKIKKAKNFEGTLTFCDGSTSKANLGDEIEEGSSERVKYLPQNYIDELCNKIENDGEMFQLEIEKVIFSHIPVEKRLETQNLTGFIEQKTEITNLEIKKIKEKIKIGTRGLANLYKKDTQTYKKKISNELNDKFEEYLNHLKFKPAITDSPVVQNNEKYSSNCLKKLIETYRLDLKNISNAIESKKTRLAFLTKEIIKVETFNEKVKFIKESINSLIDDNKDFLERNELDKNLISLNYDSEKMNQIQKLLQMEQEDIENKLNSENEESLISKRDNIQKKISRGNNLSTFQERAHQASLNEMQEWQSTLRSIVGDEGDSESLSGLNLLMNDLVGLDDKILESKNYLIDLSKDIFRLKLSLLESFKESYQGVQSFIDNYEDIQSDLNLNFYADINIFDLDDRFFSFITYSKKGSFYGEKEGNEQLKNLVSSISLESAESIEKFLKDLIIMLENNINKNNEKTEISSLLRKNKNVEDFLEMVFSLDYTKAQYSLRKDDNKISLLSPGDKGLVLLVFYLLIDTSTKPIIIDQPEENLDNQTIKKSLVPCIQEAKKHRQVILVTHNPNLAVVCGANQIIYSDINKTSGVNEVTYQSGNLQDPQINEKVVDILEGTLPAFMQREKTYYK